MRNLILVLCFSLVPCSLQAQENTSKKLTFYYDTLLMKNEIIRLIPIGTPVEQARKIITKHGVKVQVLEDSDFSVGSVMMRDIDFLYCDKSKSGGWMIEKRWQFALVYEADKITDVWVSFGLIGP